MAVALLLPWLFGFVSCRLWAVMPGGGGATAGRRWLERSLAQLNPAMPRRLAVAGLPLLLNRRHDQVMTGLCYVGSDPHKETLTLAAVDSFGKELDVLSVENTAIGIDAAVAWIGQLDGVVRVGIEGSAGHGQHLALALVHAGYDVREVPARRTAQRRRDRRRPKTDREDALAIARAVGGDENLGPTRAAHDDAVIAELDAITAWRDELVGRRTRLLNRMEAVLGALPIDVLDRIGRTGKVLTRARRARTFAADIGATHGAAAKVRLEHLGAMVADHDELSRRIKTIEIEVRRLVRANGTTLRDEVGIDWILAARLLVEVGDPTRFRSEGHFARWCGTAAIAVSSGEGDGPPSHHRLDVGGNRRVNSALHTVSVVQHRCHPDARAYLERKRSEGKTKKEARRAHKRQLANRIIRRLWSDYQQAHPVTQPAAA